VRGLYLVPNTGKIRSRKLIVADEAVSALDVSVKAQVINLLLDLQAKLKLGYLFISHDMAVVERLSHRVAVMYLGEIVEIGSRTAIFGNPQHPYTRKLMAAVPVADPSRRPEKRTIQRGDRESDPAARLCRPYPDVPEGRQRSSGARERIARGKIASGLALANGARLLNTTQRPISRDFLAI
jgi:peptide/nickel transport system ATP-binding protein